jgi:hypothetical protein
VRALRFLFKLDNAQDMEVEEALLARRGAAAVEQFNTIGETQVANV